MEDPIVGIAAAVAAGKNVVVLGARSLPVPGRPVRVDATNGDASLGPLEEARIVIGQRLGESPQHMLATRRAMTGRRQLLGEHWEPQAAAAFIDACNRLHLADESAALVIEHADALDQASAETLMEVLGRSTELTLPLVFCFRVRPDERLAALLAALASAGAQTFEVGRAKSVPPPSFELDRLDPEALVVLRTTLVLGPELDAWRVGTLLGLEPLQVVERIQRAADAGFPVADRGDARFSVPRGVLESLRERTLPSLIVLMHRRLAELLSEEERTLIAAPPAPLMDTERPRYEDVFDAEPASAADRPPTIAPEAAPRVTLEPPQTAERSPVDRARAATHFEAAGDLHNALEQLLAAAEESAERGDPRRALALVSRGHELIDQLAPGTQQGIYRARLHLLRGVILWRGASLGPPFTLPAALEALDAGVAALPTDPDVGVLAELARARAGVLYDSGGVKSLGDAIGTLSDAIRALSKAGRPQQAASLLNDQAAVYLRAGDPVRAFHLLSRSQTVFEKLREDDPDNLVAAVELAETDHLLAKLPLHAPLRPGREADAVTSALDHAKAAERVYRETSNAYELGRVWETMGRLELSRSRTDEAIDHLDRALNLQRQIIDVVGLARTTAALSDACFETERAEEALGLLADSIELNNRKGSAVGLAYNHRAVVAAHERLSKGRLAHAVGRLEALLAEAESRVGHVELP